MDINSIALDGPSGAGKSTLARMASKKYGLIYVDTGALYRCVGLYALRNNASSRDVREVTALLPEIELLMQYDAEGIQRMYLCGEDVTDDIRLPDVSKYASDVSAMPPVRDFLLSLQRDMIGKYDVIMDGRDIGTVIMPGAGLKVFLTADLEVRAKRRYLELLEKDRAIEYSSVLQDMITRDKNDSERATAPLRASEDSIILDTTELNLNESLNALCNLINAKFGYESKL